MLTTKKQRHPLALLFSNDDLVVSIEYGDRPVFAIREGVRPLVGLMFRDKKGLFYNLILLREDRRTGKLVLSDIAYWFSPERDRHLWAPLKRGEILRTVALLLSNGVRVGTVGGMLRESGVTNYFLGFPMFVSDSRVETNELIVEGGRIREIRHLLASFDANYVLAKPLLDTISMRGEEILNYDTNRLKVAVTSVTSTHTSTRHISPQTLTEFVAALLRLFADPDGVLQIGSDGVVRAYGVPLAHLFRVFDVAQTVKETGLSVNKIIKTLGCGLSKAWGDDTWCALAEIAQKRTAPLQKRTTTNLEIYRVLSSNTERVVEMISKVGTTKDIAESLISIVTGYEARVENGNIIIYAPSKEDEEALRFIGCTPAEGGMMCKPETILRAFTEMGTADWKKMKLEVLIKKYERMGLIKRVGNVLWVDDDIGKKNLKLLEYLLKEYGDASLLAVFISLGIFDKDTEVETLLKKKTTALMRARFNGGDVYVYVEQKEGGMSLLFMYDEGIRSHDMLSLAGAVARELYKDRPKEEVEIGSLVLNTRYAEIIRNLKELLIHHLEFKKDTLKSISPEELHALGEAVFSEKPSNEAVRILRNGVRKFAEALSENVFLAIYFRVFRREIMKYISKYGLDVDAIKKYLMHELSLYSIRLSTFAEIHNLTKLDDRESFIKTIVLSAAFRFTDYEVIGVTGDEFFIRIPSNLRKAYKLYKIAKEHGCALVKGAFKCPTIKVKEIVELLTTQETNQLTPLPLNTIEELLNIVELDNDVRNIAKKIVAYLKTGKKIHLSMDEITLNREQLDTVEVILETVVDESARKKLKNILSVLSVVSQ